MIDVAILGAGPYGLSLAAHLKRKGVRFRIFGRLMDSWQAHMPKGMLLKSDGFASNISDPDNDFTLRDFSVQNEIEYEDKGFPISLETFVAYGAAFQKRLIPELEGKLAVGIDRSVEGFVLRLDDGEILLAHRVVLAVGITHFAYVPPNLAQLPSQFVSHSWNHHDLKPFKGRRVAVVGGGSSAIDLAGLLHEAGAEVQLVARQKSLRFHTRATTFPRPLWERIRYPQSGLGLGLRSRLFCDWPTVFHYLPEQYRLQTVRTHLGPSGGWFAKDKVIGRVPLILGHSLEHAEIHEGCVRLRSRGADGSDSEVLIEHVIAATGYRVDLERLKFLSSEIRSKLARVEGTPLLSSAFQSSVPGLYFAGLAAANSFGPLLRFVFGARFAATRLTAALTKGLSRGRASVSVPNVATKNQSQLLVLDGPAVASERTWTGDAPRSGVEG